MMTSVVFLTFEVFYKAARTFCLVLCVGSRI